jgi:glyoxylase-like metal-dependent hydrolase (beta-lactamase superfamily II)
MDSKFFTVKEIAPGTTAIGGLGNELCYLLEGTERALLIDALTGAGNLRAFCRELTDLPITLVNTHGHLDHAGGNFDFGECFIHPDDISLIYEIKKESRMAFVNNAVKNSDRVVRLSEGDFTDSKPIKTIPITDGYFFELGNRKIEVIAVPGHTRGTIVLLDRGARLVFSGDACNVNTLLFLPHSTSIEEYQAGLGHFKEIQPYFDVMWGGHGLAPVPKVIIDEAIELCGEILAGTDDAEAGEFIDRPCFYGKKKGENFMRLDGKTANIAYSKEKIRRALG